MPDKILFCKGVKLSYLMYSIYIDHRFCRYRKNFFMVGIEL